MDDNHSVTFSTDHDSGVSISLTSKFNVKESKTIDFLCGVIVYKLFMTNYIPHYPYGMTYTDHC